MGMISTGIQLYDNFSPVLFDVCSAVDYATTNFNELQDSISDASFARTYDDVGQQVEQVGNEIDQNTQAQAQFNQTVSNASGGFDGLISKVTRLAAAYLSVQTAGKALDLSDELTQTTARLNLMNDQLQTTPELFNMIYASARNTHAPLLDTADAIAKMGNNAGAAFSSNAELVAFMEQVNKQFVIGGASAEEQANAMMQLSQSMASGALRGDELNSILEAAPEIARSIETSMGWAEGSIKSYAEEGVVTAQVVKESLLNMADETNAMFESMPLTFSQAMTDIQSSTIVVFQPFLQRLNEIANSEAFQAFVNGAIEALAVLAGVVLEVFDFMAECASFVADNWSVISPIIYGIIAALAVYVAISAIVATVNGVIAASQAVHAAASMMAAGATFVQTAAQYGLNAALAACPITWIIVLIIALIAIIFAVCQAIANMTGVATSGFGVICGAVATAGAFIGNIVIGLINTIIGIGIELYNLIATFANFFANVFNDPVGAIISLFSGMFDFILGIVQSAAKLIDTVLGTDMSGAVAGFRETVANAVDDIVGDQVEVMTKLDASDYQLDRLDYSDSFDAGASWGDGVADAVSNFSLEDAFGGGTEMPNPADYSSQFGDMGDNLGSIADDTSGISDAMDITSEDLKYLRDIAEQESVNRYTTAEIRIEQTNNNNISSDMDLDGFMNGLTDAVNEAVDTMTEGVHE